MNKLRKILSEIDGKGYGGYKRLKGTHTFKNFTLEITHVQPDPYAPPSRMIIKIPLNHTGFPRELYSNPSRKKGFVDYLTRLFGKENKNPYIRPARCGQEILLRSSVGLSGGVLSFRFRVELPAAGRRILGKEAERIFFRDLPVLVEKVFFYRNVPQDELKRHVELCEDQDFLREKLREEGWVAFVGNGAVLPRRSGIDVKPMENAVRFVSPPSMRVSFKLPSGRDVEGMGIREGITIICGGGFHGKSTLLEAIELGVYNHIEGDGREWVITREDAVKIRAEDGRYIEKVDISPFISNLPFGKDTRRFSTPDASGSTSQAANIMEALELGSGLLLIDEDTTATNLMIRDRRMQHVVGKEKEPITPFIDRIRELWERFNVSVIMITGGLGDYFEVADRVIAMEEYVPHEITEKAREVVKNYPSGRKVEVPEPFRMPEGRKIKKESVNPVKGKKIKIDAKGKETLVFGREVIDLSCIEQVVDVGQVKAIGDIIYYAVKKYSGLPLKEMLERAIEDTVKEEFQNLRYPDSCDYSLPRIYEVGAALNRLRTLKVI